MITCPQINDYLHWAAENPDQINEERKLLFKNIVFPLLLRDDVFFDQETYENSIKYAEHWYYKLFPYQKFIYAFFFMYINDHPLFRTFVIVMGRGNGKDGLMMPLLNFFQTPLYGVTNYHIDIVANAEEPARNSFNAVYSMLEDNKDKMRMKFYWNKEEIINRSTKSVLRFNTSNNKTKYGKQTGLVLFNEYHTYEDYEQIKTFTSGLGKIRHPRIVIITTVGKIQDGPLAQTIVVCNSVLNGEDNQLGYFPFICKLDNESEIDQPEYWIKANPSLDYFPVLKQTLHDEYVNMQKVASLRVEFITMRMNLPRQDESISIASREMILRSTYDFVYDESGRETSRTPRRFPNLRGENAICGLDLSEVRDFASAGFLFKKDDEFIWTSKTWVCSRSPFFKDIKFPLDCVGQEGYEDFVITNGPTIDFEEVIRWIVEKMDDYNVIKVIGDNYRFQLVKNICKSYGLSQEDKQNPYGMLRMIRNFPAVMSMTIPIIEYNFSYGKINAGNSAMWRWAVNNTGVKIDGNGNKQFYKIEPKLRKNDPFMAFAAGMSGSQLLEEKIIYI